MRNPFSDKTAKSARAIRLLTLLGVFALVAAVGGIAYAASQGPAVRTPIITSGPADPTAQTSASFAFRADGSSAGLTFQCSLDSAAFATCTSPKAYAGPLANGLHTFQVRARNAAGQLSSAASRSWTVDTIAPPAPVIDSGPASLSSSSRATFAFHDAEAHVRFRCRLDGRSLDACDSPQTYLDLRDGLHTFTVDARDAAGNASGATSRSWTVDTTAPPKPTITQHPANPSNDVSATFAFTEAEAGAQLECRLDKGAWTGCVSPTSYGSLSAATHTFSVRAFDAAGNRSGSADFSWKVTAQNGQPFQVSGDLTGLLLPGSSGALVLKVSNPNSVPIFVTSLTVTVKAGSTKPGCDGPTNLQVTQSSASAATPLTIPANGSVTLPAGGITTPQVGMKNLPTNQDACKGATFTFTYGGSAHS